MSGIIPAPYFFEVREESGEVILKSDLKSDRGFQYIVSADFIEVASLRNSPEVIFHRK